MAPKKSSIYLREPVNIRTLFDLQRVSQFPQYNSAILDNTPGFIWDKRRCLRDRPIKDCFCQPN
jgi:hypothetical protein